MNETTRAPSGTRGLRGMGRTLRRGDTWWVAYYFNGKEIRESAKSRNEGTQTTTEETPKEITGVVSLDRGEKLTVDDLLDALITHLETRGAKTVPVSSRI